MVAPAAEAASLEEAGWLWNDLGYHRWIVADYAGARAAYERALAIDEAAFGPDHPNVARDVNNLGSVLQDLGTAALYHDCGYAAGGPAGAGVAVAFERHAAVGARLLLRQKGFHEAKTRRLLAILQHHRDANDPLGASLFGRVLRVAEDYDALARRSGKLSPSMALALMLKWAGTRYDTVLLQLVVNALGAYPPGTLLRLPDGRIVRSAVPARGPESFAQPLARVLRLPPRPQRARPGGALPALHHAGGGWRGEDPEPGAARKIRGERRGENAGSSSAVDRPAHQ